MSVQGRIEAAVPDADALGRLAEENALLRAALGDMRARLDEMEQTSESDPLTGLPNRPAFLRALERSVSRANRHGTPAALLYLDINALDAINADHGRIAGDAALLHVAKLLAGLIRTTDFAARVGGDEFAVILDHLDTDSAIETAERIGRFVVEHPLDLGASKLPIVASIGVATILRGDTQDDVLRRGEVTMQKAKTA
jgi:diguanylate cyclase (GGDEF)-like protein